MERSRLEVIGHPGGGGGSQGCHGIPSTVNGGITKVLSKKKTNAFISKQCYVSNISYYAIKQRTVCKTKNQLNAIIFLKLIQSYISCMIVKANLGNFSVCFFVIGHERVFQNV